MSCEDLKLRVAQAGAMIVEFQSSRVGGLTVYDRYVSNDSFCMGESVVELKYVPAGDTPNCALRRCVPL